MNSYIYLAIDLGCVAIPLLASFYRKFPFYKEWKYFIPANLIVAVFFLIWDIWYTRLGVWGFNPKYITGFYFFNLPIEEVLFFICIPYACVFTYYAGKIFLFPSKENNGPSFLLYFFLGLTGTATLLFYNKMYTFYTSLLLFMSLMFLLFRRVNIQNIFISYLMITPFFFISNGILTGSFLEEPIVWYNDQENLQIRMFTIPVEDIFYGFLLILWNILLYEYFKSKTHIAT